MREKVTIVDETGSEFRPFRVFFADGILGSAAERLEGVEGIEFFGQDKTTRKELEALLSREGDDAIDALVVRSATKLARNLKKQKPGIVLDDPSVLLAQARTLGLIIRAGIGTDNIDEQKAAEHGRVVENTPEGNIQAVVVKTLRDIEYVASPQFKNHLDLRLGRTRKPQWSEQSEAFKGKTFGVVGLGNIGGRVAREIIKRGGIVIGYDPYATVEGVENVSLDELCARSDVITVHAALNESSNNMIGVNQFRLMKEGVVVINNARGGIVNEASLLEELKSEHVGVAVLDVFTIEGDAMRDDGALRELDDEEQEHIRTVIRPLLDHPRVVASMHAAANSKEAQTRNGIDVASQVINFARGKGIMNGVNFPSVNIQNGASAYPIDGPSVRFLVLNRNQRGVHDKVHEALRGVDDRYNREGVFGLPSRDGKRAAIMEEGTLRRPDDPDSVLDISLETARKMLLAMRGVEGVLGVKMFKVDRR